MFQIFSCLWNTPLNYGKLLIDTEMGAWLMDIIKNKMDIIKNKKED